MIELWIPLTGIIVCIGLPIVAVIVLGHKIQGAKHAERMAMIEKGIFLEEPEKHTNKFNVLRNGLLMIGLALGAVAGIAMCESFRFWERNFMIFISSILGGGIAFIIYFFIAQKMQKMDEKED